MRAVCVFVCVSALVCHAAAQNLNIDFDDAAGAAASAPLDFFGGAAAQTGRWNAVPASGPGPVPLTDLAGSPTPVLLRRLGGSDAFTFDNPNSNGEAHYLLDDIVDVGPQGTVATIRLEGLIPGHYEVFTYAIAPDNATARTSVFLPGSTSVNPQIVGGEIPAGVWVEGITHARHTAPVAADGVLAIQATATTGFGSINGLQVRLLAPARLYVNAAAAPGGDGTSWSKALADLQSAITVARSQPSAVREIWVARTPFAYFPSAPAGRAATFHFTTQASIYGGFVGTETTIAERDLSGGYTLLSGSGAGGAGLNADWVVTFAPSGALFDGRPACLDGFGIIRGGNADGADGGGVRISGGVLRRSTVALCRGTNGGGVRMSDFAAMADCFIHSNQADRGGGVHVSGNNSFITSTTIAANTAAVNGGGMYITGFTAVQNSLLYLNHAAGGGAIAAVGPTVSPSLTNCTIADNSAGIYGGVYIVDTDGVPGGPSLFNTILWNNLDTDAGTDSRRCNLEYNHWPLGIGASRCIIEGFAGGPPFQFTVNADPLFTLPAIPGGPLSGDEDYTPMAGSPAIDSGDTDRVRFDEFDVDHDGDTAELLPWDAKRNPRIVDDPAAPDTGAGGPPLVDIGAVERVPTLCPADFNQDGGIDGADVNDFYAAWEAGAPHADVNQDGGVDGADVDTFFEAWEAGGCG